MTHFDLILTYLVDAIMRTCEWQN